MRRWLREAALVPLVALLGAELVVMASAFASGVGPLRGSSYARWDSHNYISIARRGYYLEEAEEEADRFLQQPEFADTPAARNGNVFAVDATSFFSRPGPRIVDGLEILAWAVHPDFYPAPPDGTIAKLG